MPTASALAAILLRLRADAAARAKVGIRDGSGCPGMELGGLLLAAPEELEKVGIDLILQG